MILARVFGVTIATATSGCLLSYFRVNLSSSTVHAKTADPSESLRRWPDRKWLKELLHEETLLPPVRKDPWEHRRVVFAGKGYLNDDSRLLTKTFWDQHQKKLKGYVEWGMEVEGPPNCVHGGCIAAVSDQLLGRTVSAAVPDELCVTINLCINYKKFIPLNSLSKMEGEVERIEGRKVYLKGKIFDPETGVIHSEATAIFLMIQNAKKFAEASNNTARTFVLPKTHDGSGNDADPMTQK